MAYPAGLKYTKDHEWVELSGDRAKVGITDYAQQQLGDVVYIELPEVGPRSNRATRSAPSNRSRPCRSCTRRVSGEVVEVNTALKNKPEAVNANPHESWMMVVKLTNPGETSALLDATQYADLVK